MFLRLASGQAMNVDIMLQKYALFQRSEAAQLAVVRKTLWKCIRAVRW